MSIKNIILHLSQHKKKIADKCTMMSNSFMHYNVKRSYRYNPHYSESNIKLCTLFKKLLSLRRVFVQLHSCLKIPRGIHVYKCYSFV